MQRNIKIILVVLLAGNLIGLGLLFGPTLFEVQDPVRIAVCLPLETPRGQMMQNGINLYLDRLKRLDPEMHHRIQINFFDDQNVPQQATALAHQICTENQALLVLGHDDNQSALAAGKLYRRYGMLAITGTATAPSLTRNNEWYFSIVPDDTFKFASMALFLKTSDRPVHLIQKQSPHFESMLEEAFKKAGITLQRKYRFSNSKDLERIIERLNRKEPANNFYVLAMDAPEADYVLSALKSGKKDAFLLACLPDTTHSLPNSRADVYALAPFVIDVAGNRAYAFRENYYRKYAAIPSWEAASYYDAIRVVVEAVKQTTFNATDNILQKRKKLRFTLEGFNTRERSFSGIAGPLYFNQYGTIEKPYTIERYIGSQFRPIFTQYQVAQGTADDLFKEVLSGQMVRMDTHVWQIKKVVYCGMEIVHITPPDFQKATFEAEFFVWFRYKGDFNPRQVIFPDAIEPVEIGLPVVQDEQNGMTTSAFHINAPFQNRFDFHAYPFDSHALTIRFQHASRNMDELVFVQDAFGKPAAIEKTPSPSILKRSSGWSVEKITASHDTVTRRSTLGNPDYLKDPLIISHSQFNSRIHIRQSDLYSHFGDIIWLLGAILLLTSVYFIRFKQWQICYILIAFAFCAGVFNHVIISAKAWVNYLTCLDYIFFIFYGWVLITFLFAKRRCRPVRDDSNENGWHE